jgi:hypothetical protein
MKLPFLILIAFTLWGQEVTPALKTVSLQYTPDSMEVMKVYNVTNIGVGTIMACNDSYSIVSIPAERLYMAFPTVRFITPDRAHVVIMAGIGKSKKATAVRWIGYGLQAAVPIMAWGPVAASKTIIGAASVGGTIAGQVQKSLEGQIPDLVPLFSTVLDKPIALAPGACDKATVFNTKQKGISNVVTKLEVK